MNSRRLGQLSSQKNCTKGLPRSLNCLGALCPGSTAAGHFLHDSRDIANKKTGFMSHSRQPDASVTPAINSPAIAMEFHSWQLATDKK
jgi:hypothetical protein